MRIQLILLALVLLFSSCKYNTTEPAQPATNDDALRLMIIGGWHNSSYRIDYRADNTFIDTINVGTYYGGLYPDVQKLIRSGRYSVDNSVVEYSDVKFKYWSSLDTSGQHGSWAWDALPQALNIISDTMVTIETFVLSPVDSTLNQLVGKWNTSFWYRWYNDQNPLSCFEGIVRVDYQFFQDSTYSEIWNYLGRQDPSSLSHSGKYFYNSSLLHMESSNSFPLISDARIEFISSKMYWYNNYSTKLLRVK